MLERSSRKIHKDDWLDEPPQWGLQKDDAWWSVQAKVSYLSDPVWIKVERNHTHNAFFIDTKGFGNVFIPFASLDEAKDYAKKHVLESQANTKNEQWIKACAEILDSF